MVLLRLLAFAPQGDPPARPAGPAASPNRAASAAPAAVSAPVAPPPTASVATPGNSAAEPPAWLDETPDAFEAEGPTAAAAPALAAARAAPRESMALVATPLGERWAAIVAMVEQRELITALVRELALQAELVEQLDGAAPLWRLRVERESLRSAALRDKLQAALAEALGIATLRLEIEAGAVQDTPARRIAAERQRRQQQAEQMIHSDPLVQEMLAQFKTARIVPGSIKPL
jgi:DNA polymerase-3 subunit gamma/tau